MYGGLGNDILEGGKGSDVLVGGAGHDAYNFSLGDGQDTITDTALAGEGNVIQFFSGITLGSLNFIQDQIQQTLTIQVAGGDSIRLLGFDPNTLSYVVDTLDFADGTVVALADQLPLPEGLIEGTDDSNSIRTGSTDDTIFAGAGNDVVNAGAGNDTLIGGTGNDTLTGGAGQDTYVFNLGDGVDSISDSGGEGNRVVFGPGVTADSISLGRGPSGTISVRVGTAGDRIQLPGGSVTSAALDMFEFQDGSILTFNALAALGVEIGGTNGGDGIFGTELNDVIHAGPGNDFVAGRGGNDTLFGEEGDDQLRGGSGNDVLNGGPGDDVLNDSDGADLLVGGVGNDIYEVFQPSQQIIELAGEGIDTVRTAETPTHTLTLPDNIENGEMLGDFASSMSFIGNMLDNQLRGPRLLDGQSGNDLLIGEGDNVYLFGRGYGVDTIRTDTQQYYALTGQDEVQLLPGVSPDDLTLGGHANNLIVTINGTTDQLTVESYLVPGNDPIEQLRFDDGTIWTQADIASRVRFITGTNQNDNVWGLGSDNELSGLDGSDQVFGLGGNDILDGSLGDDILIGGDGSDTYLFGVGSGQDRINDLSDSLDLSDVDTILLSSTITPSQVSLQPTQEGHLVLTVAGISDTLTVESFFFGQLFQVEEIQFGEGTIWDRATILDHIRGLNLVGTEFDDFLSGFQTNDILSGLAGNDTLVGEAGDDTLLGGDGVDDLEGGGGNDTLDGGNGDDILHGGFGPNSGGEGGGEGGGGTIGDSGDDTLKGGTGHDTYVFNLGDGIDTINDVATVGEGNRIQFGESITEEDLTFTEDQAARILTIQVGANGDSLRLLNFDPIGTNGSLAVQTLAFADGGAVQLTDLLRPAEPIITEGDDVLTGTPGDDVVDALAGNDVVDTGAGNDTITGGLGNDQLTGGTGNDTYLFNAGDGVDTITDTAVAGDGNTVEFGTGITPTDLTLDVGSLLIRVGATGDAIHLTPFDPNDALGAHAIETFRFADGTTLSYSQLLARGFDLTGTAGDDQITGTNVVDRISGMAGNDALDGRAGADVLAGGDGDDTYVVDDTGDVVTELPNGGIDQVQSSIDYRLGLEVEQLILTGAANLMGTGNALDNVLTGNSGSNVLDGGVGADVMAGGAGDDAYLVEHVGDVGTEQPNEGMDSIQSSITYTLGANVEDLTLTGTAGINGTGNELDNILTGNNTANVLSGGDGDDTLTGLAENDTLQGGAGHDLLVGGTGTDTMQGGTDHDTYVLDSFGDVVIEAADEGTDTVQSTLLAYTLGTNVEHLILTGTGPSAGFGNALKNELTGNSAANLLDGRGGADTLTGGGGDDLYIVDHAGDTVAENTNEGIDTVVSGITHSLSANVENLRLIGLSAISGTGNASDNVLNGLLNLAGNTLTGGAGNDTYVLGSGDLVVEAANGGTDTVQASFSYTLGSNIEHLTLTGTAAINGTGNSLNNTITGNRANNMLSSAGGADTLRGGLGNDTVNGGSGNDIFQFGRGEGQDLIQDSSGSADKMLFDGGINPLDLVISRHANDLRLTIHGSSDRITVQNWYTSSVNRTETIQAGNGQTLLSTQVDQLIQAMASFTQQTGLTWDQAIDQRPQDVQTVLTASWQ